MTNNTYTPRRITLLVVSLLILVLMAGVAIGATWQRAAVEAELDSLPRCAQEDSSNCYWNGGSNNEGSKFIDFKGRAYPINL